MRLLGLEAEINSHIGWARQNRAEKALFLSRLLMDSYLHRRTHEAPSSAAQLGASFFSSRRLRERLGGNHRAPSGEPEYHRYLKPFWSFAGGNVGYSKNNGHTKAYELKPEAVAMIECELASDNPAFVYDSETGREIEASDLPQNGVCQSSYSTIRLDSMIRLDVAALDSKIVGLDAASAASSLLARRHHTVPTRYARIARKWSASFGGVPNLYFDYRSGNPEEGHGRLYGSGQSHFQFIPRKARGSILGGLGLYDYDFKSCHVSLICSLATVAGARIDGVANYLTNKSDIHRELSELCEVRESRVKAAFLALVYGAADTAHEGGAIGKFLGYVGAAKFLAAPIVRQFQYDIRLAGISILEWSQKTNRPEKWSSAGVLNAVGKFQPFEEEILARNGSTQKRSVPGSRILNHLVIGYEAWCLNTVLTQQNDLTCLIFDGWIGGRAPILPMQRLIYEEAEQQFRFPLSIQIDEDPMN